MYKSYLSYDEYIERDGNTLPSGNEEECLKRASRHIDSLTYNRIHKIGYENLTEFQKEILREVTLNLAIFEYENEDILSTAIDVYSINGVSMNFNSSGWNIVVQGGVAIKSTDYNLLGQTGLTTANLRI